MDLSNAIKLGATMKPHGRGATYKNGCTCAMGAALDAVGLLDAAGDIDVMSRAGWGWTVDMTKHPLTGEACSYEVVIFNLNDCHGWTREAIASWVSEIEKEMEDAEKAKANPGEIQRENSQDGNMLALDIRT